MNTRREDFADTGLNEVKINISKLHMDFNKMSTEFESVKSELSKVKQHLNDIFSNTTTIINNPSDQPDIPAQDTHMSVADEDEVFLQCQSDSNEDHNDMSENSIDEFVPLEQVASLNYNLN